MKKIIAMLAAMVTLVLASCDMAGGGNAGNGKPGGPPDSGNLAAEKAAREAYYEYLKGKYPITNRESITTVLTSEVNLLDYNDFNQYAPCGSGIWTFSEAEASKWNSHLQRILNDPETYYKDPAAYGGTHAINDSNGPAVNIFRDSYNTLKEQCGNKWKVAGLIIKYAEDGNRLYIELYQVGTSEIKLYQSERIDGAYYKRTVSAPPPIDTPDPDPNTDEICGLWKHEKGGKGSITLESEGTWLQGKYAAGGVDWKNRTWSQSGSKIIVKGKVDNGTPVVYWCETEYTLTNGKLVFTSEKHNVDGTEDTYGESYMMRNTFGNDCPTGSLVKQQ